MSSSIKLIYVFAIVAIATMVACNTADQKIPISYKVLGDSVYTGDSNYRRDFQRWKKIYEDCTRDSLFKNALYLGLQGNYFIGSISNRSSMNVNGRFSLLDTTNYGQLFKILTTNKSINCYSPLQLEAGMRIEFYKEIMKVLDRFDEYRFLKNDVDSSRLTIQITSLVDNNLVPDSVLSLLNHSSDTALVHFREKLTVTGNVLLVRTVMITGFYTQLPLSKKLSPDEHTKLAQEVFFKPDDQGNNASIKLVSENTVRITVNKYYTVLGQFYVFSDSKQHKDQ